MSRQPLIDVILAETPAPTVRDNTTVWLKSCFAQIADIPMDNVSVVYNDDQETTTVHLVCPNACRCVKTFMHTSGSDDDCYLFLSADGFLVILPFEPFQEAM